jgi:hypothetical protein
VLCLSVPANATEKNPPLTELLTESHNAGGLVSGIEQSRLPDELPSVDGLPILVCIWGMNWDRLATLSFEDAVTQAFAHRGAQYVVLEPPLRRICSYAAFEPYQIETIGPKVPTYISDILDGGQRQVFLGTEHTVENVICFDGLIHHDDMAVFYLTDGGTFVRIYDRSDSIAVEFALEDFQEKANAYYSFTNSYEYLYNEAGKRRGEVGAGFFLDYTMNPEKYHERYRHRNVSEPSSNPILVIVCVIIALAIVVIMLCWFICHRKRKKFDETIAAIQADSNSGEVSRFE